MRLTRRALLLSVGAVVAARLVPVEPQWSHEAEQMAKHMKRCLGDGVWGKLEGLYVYRVGNQNLKTLA